LIAEKKIRSEHIKHEYLENSYLGDAMSRIDETFNIS
jgi:hypothetical protein